MLEKFLSKTKFDSYEDFMQNFKVNVPENFNFGYDVVDEWARTNPDKPALLWTNEQGEKIQFTFADIKRESDKAASFFTSLGIGRGDMVMLIPLPILVLHHRAPQNRSHHHSRHPSADGKRHRLPLPVGRHQGHRCRRRRHRA